jgi:hypothetical protein
LISLPRVPRAEIPGNVPQGVNFLAIHPISAILESEALMDLFDRGQPLYL